VSREALLVLKEALAVLTIGRRVLRIWAFVARITEVILGIGVLLADERAVNLMGHVLRLVEDVPLWPPEANQLAGCERLVTTRLEHSMETANRLLESSMKESYRQGLHIAKTSVEAE
jgi:hypothetical protein